MQKKLKIKQKKSSKSKQTRHWRRQKNGSPFERVEFQKIGILKDHQLFMVLLKTLFFSFSSSKAENASAAKIKKNCLFFERERPSSY